MRRNLAIGAALLLLVLGLPKLDAYRKSVNQNKSLLPQATYSDINFTCRDNLECSIALSKQLQSKKIKFRLIDPHTLGDLQLEANLYEKFKSSDFNIEPVLTIKNQNFRTIISDSTSSRKYCLGQENKLFFSCANSDNSECNSECNDLQIITLIDALTPQVFSKVESLKEILLKHKLPIFTVQKISPSTISIKSMSGVSMEIILAFYIEADSKKKPRSKDKFIKSYLINFSNSNITENSLAVGSRFEFVNPSLTTLSPDAIKTTEQLVVLQEQALSSAISSQDDRETSFDDYSLVSNAYFKQTASNSSSTPSSYVSTTCEKEDTIEFTVTTGAHEAQKIDSKIDPKTKKPIPSDAKNTFDKKMREELDKIKEAAKSGSYCNNPCKYVQTGTEQKNTLNPKSENFNCMTLATVSGRPPPTVFCKETSMEECNKKREEVKTSALEELDKKASRNECPSGLTALKILNCEGQACQLATGTDCTDNPDGFGIAEAKQNPNEQCYVSSVDSCDGEVMCCKPSELVIRTSKVKIHYRCELASGNGSSAS